MGRAVAAAAAAKGITVGAEVDAGDDLAAALRGCDVVVDFSVPVATPALVDLALAAGVPLVIGTTGHEPAQRAALEARIAARVPCVWTGNFSVGVTLLAHLARTAAARLGPEYHAEVVELHHQHKKDAPSGTALLLADAVLGARDWTREALRHGREGITGARIEREVGMHSLRLGDVVGDHTVHFGGPGERLELTHRATNRDVFAQGAIRAAVWVCGRAPGLYGMPDVLDLR
jgi:4-hydroxy-tetrahydrodipicolinate reductase